MKVIRVYFQRLLPNSIKNIKDIIANNKHPLHSDKQGMQIFIERYGKESYRDIEVDMELYKGLKAERASAFEDLCELLIEYFRCSPNETRTVLYSEEHVKIFKGSMSLKDITVNAKNGQFVVTKLPLPKYNSGNFYITKIQLSLKG